MKDQSNLSSNPELNIFFDKISSEKLLRHTCQFFKKGVRGMEPYGSGVLISIHNIYIIVTASHVAEYLTDEKNDLFLRIGLRKFINITGEVKKTEIEDSKGIDLAYIKLTDETVDLLKPHYVFTTIDKIRDHNNLTAGSNYCVIGFPENNIKRDSGVLRTGATAYFTSASNDKVYEYYKYDKSDFIIVEMKGKGTDIPSGAKQKINTHLHGISGCGLWYIIVSYDQETKKYSCDYKLIGIMTEYKKGKYFCLIGNKIKFIIQALEILENVQFRRIPQ